MRIKFLAQGHKIRMLGFEPPTSVSRYRHSNHMTNMLRYAVSMSTNTTYNDLIHSYDCSRIWLWTKMWSMHNFPYLKPACCWCSSFSTAAGMRWRTMRQKILQVMDSSVMPLQLLHSDRLPFFGSLMTVPSSKRLV